mgnify:CR=1 FL=1
MLSGGFQVGCFQVGMLLGCADAFDMLVEELLGNVLDQAGNMSEDGVY